MQKLKKLKIILKSFVIVLVISAVVFCACACNFDSVVKKASKNLTEYNIEAVLDDNAKTITAKQTVNYLNSTGVTLNNVCFNLYAKAFQETATVKPYTALTEAKCFPNGKSYGDIIISSLKVNNTPVSVVTDGVDGNILNVELLSPLKNGDRAQISLEYTLILPNCVARFGYNKNNINLGNWYPIACVYENGEFNKTPYYATGDPFYSNLANYNIKLTVPSSYVVASSGIENNTTTEENLKTYNFSGRAIRDFAMCLSKDYVVLTDTISNTKVNYFAFSTDENPAEYLKLACEALQYFNKLFGVYPYRVLNVAKASFLHGGMEYPNLVLASDNLTTNEEFRKVIVHEIAHQWWFGVCGNNEIVDAWFDEGLSEYSTFLFFGAHQKYNASYASLINDAKEGYNLYREVFDSIGVPINNKMNLAVNMYANEYEYTYMIYVRGVIMFDEIQNTIGQKNFIKALKKLYKKYKFKTVNFNSFTSVFGKRQKAVQNIMNNYFNGTCYLDA